MTDTEYVKAAWLAYEQGLRLKDFAHLVAHCHVGMKDLNHAVRSKLWKLRKAGYGVPMFNVKGLKRFSAIKDKMSCFAQNVIDYMEGVGGPLHELWDDDLIFSYNDDTMIDDKFEAMLQDIRDGKIVGYQSDSQADDREAYEPINLYLNAREMLEALTNEPG